MEMPLFRSMVRLAIQGYFPFSIYTCMYFSVYAGKIYTCVFMLVSFIIHTCIFARLDACQKATINIKSGLTAGPCVLATFLIFPVSFTPNPNRTFRMFS